MKSQIRFAEKKLKLAFEKLKSAKVEELRLYDWINRAMDDIEQNAFCATQIHKRLIPKEYIRKYGIDNLWKYDLPNGWRLLYSVGKEGVVIVSIVLEWLDHKSYERRFSY